MPVKSKAQWRLMAAAAHDTGFAKRSGIDPKVAREFLNETPKGVMKQLPSKAAKRSRKRG
jgi:hypothetical protein